MTHLHRGDADLHHEDGSHRSTPASAAGHVIGQHYRRVTAHLEAHHTQRCTCEPSYCAGEGYGDDDPRACRYCAGLDSERPCPADPSRQGEEQRTMTAATKYPYTPGLFGTCQTEGCAEAAAYEVSTRWHGYVRHACPEHADTLALAPTAHACSRLQHRTPCDVALHTAEECPLG